ncbi:hypothetical protein BN940_14346 [Castellaniella defragrans 65Phen]|uniref:Uncharacterized protein n=1 Tax=Castellaniella defragrans (strain DSM 12143 / CCUG 39792 / 65Phen) TaxID=1437824 RepID=W8X0B0_CASD6|nr:hypothetical protein BN940_14346 [Castellaniella defragrans 65Phen]
MVEGGIGRSHAAILACDRLRGCPVDARRECPGGMSRRDVRVHAGRERPAGMPGGTPRHPA